MVSRSDLLSSELDELLSEPVRAAQDRERHTFDRAVAPFDGRLVLCGAGNLGRKILAALRAEGIEPLAFVDNNPKLWGTLVAGLSVFSPPEAARCFAQSATFCITIWQGEGTQTMSQRMQQFRNLGCENVIDFGALFWKFSERLLPHYSLDLPHKVLLAADDVRSAFDLWSDAASRAEYVAQIRWRLRLDFDHLLPVADEIYFPPDLFKISGDEVFVDCGAFDGDTIREFLARSAGQFRQIYAFEADPVNFSKLTRFIDDCAPQTQGRITAIRKAVSERMGVLKFSATGTAASAIGAHGIDVECEKLDQEVVEPPTWIKMDIEGSEMAALRGAQETIMRHAPILCICVYHTQDHLWNVPLLIAAHHAGYKMFLRPHLRESWDLVCYAVPESRVI
jgi:FkbM family methyltransferase